MTEAEQNAMLRKAAGMMRAVLVEKEAFYKCTGRNALGPQASSIRDLLWRDADREALDAMEAYLATINPQPALFEDDAA